MCSTLILLAGIHLLLAPAAPQPNILFIMADDLGYEDLGFQGSDILTPNLDRLARAGVVLENHYVMPMCAPSRASFLTGRNAIKTGFWSGNMSPFAEWGLDLAETTIAEMLKGYGYSTHLIGKWHQGMSTWSMTPVMRGFDTFLGQYHGAGNYFSHIIQDAYDLREDYRVQGAFVDKIRTDLNGTYSTNIYTDRTLSLIEENTNSTDPWFIFLSYTAPHKQYMAPKEDIAEFSSHMIYSSPERKKYATMMSILDRGVGQIEEALRRTGALENTLIVFTSDNGAVIDSGGGSNYPLKGGKKSFYEGGVRAVSFVNSPLLKKTGYVNRNIHHISDWFPTFEYLASSAGNAGPGRSKGIDGTNIWLSLSNGVGMRDSVLINMANNVNQPTETNEMDSETQPEPEKDFILKGKVMKFEEKTEDVSVPLPAHFSPEMAAIFNKINHNTLLQGNAIFVFRWYYWKLILGDVGSEDCSASKTIQKFSQPPPNQTHVRLLEYDNVKRVQLYNLNTDPGEQYNLSKVNPSVVKIIAKKMLDYVMDIKPLRRTYSELLEGRETGVWMPWLDAYPPESIFNET